MTHLYICIYIYIYIERERERERERGVHTHLYICIYLESTGAAPGLLQPHPTCMDAACGGQHRWPLVCAMAPFFFFVCGFAPIWVEFDCIGRNLPKHAEKGRIRLKPALNHSEILVKKKKKCKTHRFELWSSLPTASLIISLSVSPLSLPNLRSFTQKSESLLCLIAQAHSSSLGLNLSVMECFSF